MLTESEWIERAVPARDRVFTTLDPFDAPFSEDVVERRLLFPVSYQLEPAQIAIVRAAAKGVGDESIFLESRVDSTPDAFYWEFSADGEGPYDVIESVLENAILSSSGKWGMTISEEDHAVIGGVPEFMQMIAESFPATKSPSRHMFRHPTELEPAADASLDEILEEFVARSDAIPMATDQPFGDGRSARVHFVLESSEQRRPDAAVATHTASSHLREPNTPNTFSR